MVSCSAPALNACLLKCRTLTNRAFLCTPRLQLDTILDPEEGAIAAAQSIAVQDASAIVRDSETSIRSDVSTDMALASTAESRERSFLASKLQGATE